MAGVKPTLERIRSIQKMLDENSYAADDGKLPRWRRFVHFCVLVFKSFQKNRGPVRASSLAYTTILSLVPVLAVVVSISTGFLQKNQATVIDDLMNQFITTVAPQLDLMSAEGGAADGKKPNTSRQEVVQRIKDYINTMNSGTLGVTAGIALIFIAISVLSSVENTFNDIWGVTRGRTWFARIVQYWAAITLAPLFLVTAIGITGFAQGGGQSKQAPGTKQELGNKPVSTNTELSVSNTFNPPTNEIATTSSNTTKSKSALASEIPATILKKVSAVKDLVKSESATNPPASAPEAFNLETNITDIPLPGGGTEEKLVISEKPPGMFTKLSAFLHRNRAIAQLTSLIMLSVFSTLFYKLMPNTKVRWDAAIVGGLVGGCLLQLNNLFSVIYLSKVVSYSKIYGSLSAIPIFLVGLYFSWIIVLLGAQVAYAYQNRQAYIQERQTESINQRGREFAAMRLMTHIAQTFHSGQEPSTRLRMAETLGIPSQLTAQILCALVAAKLLVEVNGGEETGYSPARPIDKISVEDILCALRAGQGSELATADDPGRAILREEYERVILAEMHAAGAVTLQSLVMRVSSAPQHRQKEQHPIASVAA